MGKETRPQRDAVSLVIASEKLSLQSGHVDAGGALGLTALAGDTQIHDLGHARAGQLVRRQDAGHRRPQRIGPAARAVFLLARHHEAGAHRPAILAAYPAAVTHLHRADEAVDVIGRLQRDGNGWSISLLYRQWIGIFLLQNIRLV